MIWHNKRGKAQVIAVLVLAAALLAACMPLAGRLYWIGFNALMTLWGVTEQNVSGTPWLIRAFIRYSGVILMVIQGGLLLIGSLRLSQGKRLKTEKAPRRNTTGQCARGGAAGAGSMLVLWLALLALDNMRLGRPLSRPQWSVNALILPLTIALTTAAILCWGVGWVFRFLAGKMPWPAAVAVSSAMLAAALLDSAQVTPLLPVNLLLCGAVCCLSARKTGCWAWSWGFLCAVRLLERAVLGFPGFSAALYETYPVNYYWLNGGERGLWHGLAMTLLMLFHGIRLARALRKKSASSS